VRHPDVLADLIDDDGAASVAPSFLLLLSLLFHVSGVTMSDLICNPNGTTAPFSVPANGTLAVWSLGAFQVLRLTSGVNQPAITTILSDTLANGPQFQSGVLSTTVATSLQIFASGGLPVYYAINSADATAVPAQLANVRTERLRNAQGTPATLNATGTLLGGAILAGIVTSTTGAAVAATLDTGTVMDTVSNFAIGDAFEWTVVNTGGFTFTVTASAGHTIVGVGAVLTLISSRWQTRKTAAATFVSTRLS
jgi:hypothetical protein